MNTQSWGRYPKPSPKREILYNGEKIPSFDCNSVLPFGLGRSYGDSCLNNGEALLLTSSIDNFISFDEESSLLVCQGGVSLAEILKVFVPKGWFLPVSPGTKFVTVGGAIANDIHGKNHHKEGSFGCHVEWLDLKRSDGKTYRCSKTENGTLFEATLGGLGLTGLIERAAFKLKKISSAFIDEEVIQFRDLSRFFDLSLESEKAFEYTVSWVDCLSEIPRGLFMRGNFSAASGNASTPKCRTFPIDAPSWALSKPIIKAFNWLYFNKQRSEVVKRRVPYEPFFYPLDSIHNWNRMYGKRGFLQWQCVVPYSKDRAPIEEIFHRISRSGKGSFLAVLKTFGDKVSPGLLSFPRKGVTLALDFPNDGEKTFSLLNSLDEVVREAKGAIYPAKDARMSKETFQVSFPRLKEFISQKDPKFSSSFWRRVT